MLKLLFGKEDMLSFERTDSAPVAVWDALTRPDAVREWWGAKKTVVTDCEIGSGAKMAAVGMRYDYKQYAEKLDTRLSH